MARVRGVLRQHRRRRPAHDVPELPRRDPRPVTGQAAPARPACKAPRPRSAGRQIIPKVVARILPGIWRFAG